MALSEPKVEEATQDDFNGWIMLAREVESLFGPMADEVSFREALQDAIASRQAFCVRERETADNVTLPGGIVIANTSNEIVWLAVSEQYRGKGFGRELLSFALSKLDLTAPVHVQTFDRTCKAGLAARRLYEQFGFVDYGPGETNPAGIPTVVMRRMPKAQARR